MNNNSAEDLIARLDSWLKIHVHAGPPDLYRVLQDCRSELAVRTRCNQLEEENKHLESRIMQYKTELTKAINYIAELEDRLT